MDHHNVLGVLPTGGGKSICYQVPGLMLGGTTIVISPLISLMKDQVDQLKAMGIKAAFLNSSLTKKQQKEIEDDLRKGHIQFLYVAPERFDNQYFLSLLSRIDIHLIAFDEAHCISKWGMTLDLAIKVSLKSIHITSKLYNRCINGNSYCRSTARYYGKVKHR